MRYASVVERVVRGVHATFGVTLEREPRLLGIDG